MKSIVPIIFMDLYAPRLMRASPPRISSVKLMIYAASSGYFFSDLDGLAFPVARKFIMIIPVEKAGRRQFLFQLSPGAVQPDLNRMKAQSEDIGNFAVFQLPQFAEDNDGPVVFRLSVHPSRYLYLFRFLQWLPRADPFQLYAGQKIVGESCPELHG